MGDTLLKILDWSEVWALLIPLAILYFKPNQPDYVKPVVTYLWFAFALNLIIDVIMVFKRHFPPWTLLQSNNPYYNIHSIIRFILFSYFFINLPQPSFMTLKKGLALFSVIFILINFGFFENIFNPDHLSGNLLTVEAYLLLIYCMQFYLSELKEDSERIWTGPAFWIVTGLSIYVVINFFVFLFYVPMLNTNFTLADNIWHVHNVAFVIFCLFLAKAFYGDFRHKYSV